ncbi:MAG: hypothetical protein ABWZ64_04745 [Xanthobacteraceae bacterium]
MSRSDGRPLELCPAAAPELSVEVVDAVMLAELEPHWCDLIGRADVCNVFFHPALVRTAAQSYAAATIRACLAWMRVGGGRQLVGVGAFATARPRKSVLPAVVLNSPPFPNAYLATPVLDRRFLDEVWSAMLDRLADDPALPKLVVLEAMSMDEATRGGTRAGSSSAPQPNVGYGQRNPPPARFRPRCQAIF